MGFLTFTNTGLSIFERGEAGKPVTCVTDIDDKMVDDIVNTGNKFSANFLQDSFFLTGVVNAMNKKRVLT